MGRQANYGRKTSRIPRKGTLVREVYDVLQEHGYVLLGHELDAYAKKNVKQGFDRRGISLVRITCYALAGRSKFRVSHTLPGGMPPWDVKNEPVDN